MMRLLFALTGVAFIVIGLSSPPEMHAVPLLLAIIGVGFVAHGLNL